MIRQLVLRPSQVGVERSACLRRRLELGPRPAVTLPLLGQLRGRRVQLPPRVTTRCSARSSEAWLSVRSCCVAESSPSSASFSASTVASLLSSSVPRARASRSCPSASSSSRTNSCACCARSASCSWAVASASSVRASASFSRRPLRLHLARALRSASSAAVVSASLPVRPLHLAAQLGLALLEVRAGRLELALQLADALELRLHLRVHLGLDALALLVRLGQLSLQRRRPRVALGEAVRHLLAEVLELELEVLPRRSRRLNSRCSRPCTCAAFRASACSCSW